MYEGYGPGGVALLVECLTDNRNRAAAEVRTALTRNGGSWPTPAASRTCSPARASSLVPKGCADRGRRAGGGAGRRRRGGQRPRGDVRGRQRGRPTWSPSAPPCRTPGSTTTRPRPRSCRARRSSSTSTAPARSSADRRARGQRRRAERLRQLRRRRRGAGRAGRGRGVGPRGHRPAGAAPPLRTGQHRVDAARRGLTPVARPLCSVGAEHLFGLPRRYDHERGGRRARARRRPRADPLRVGVVEGGPGQPLRLVAVDVVRTPPDRRAGERLLALADRARAWLDRHSPDVVAVERVFSQHNVRTVMGTAQASAVADAGGRAARACPVALHTPSEVKAAVTGNGRADKAQVAAMVTRHAAARRRAEAGRRRRRARPGDLPRLARWRPGPSRIAAVAGPERDGGRPVIASRAAAWSRGAAWTPRCLEVGGVGLLCTRRPRTLAGLRAGAAGPAGHLAGGPRGLADAVRLRRRRRAGHVRGGADGLRDRAAARAGDARGARRPTRCARRSPPTTSPR